MKHQRYKDEAVWIIGASSGIGAALAHELAGRGARLALSARGEDKLTGLCAALGPQHIALPLDVTDAANVAAAAQSVKTAFGRIDRVILLAAAYTPMFFDQLDLSETRKIIEVNLLGSFQVIDAVLPLLREQQNGQLALCGSVAGYAGLPGGQPYSATKAALANLAESLKAEYPERPDIRLISPGFVRTGLTDKNDFPMPMIISPEKAAEAIAEGLLRRGFEIHFPKRFTLILKLLRMLPYAPFFRILRRMNRADR